MFDKYQANPIDWSLRILSALEEQKSLYERLSIAERKSPIVFCPAIKKVADVLHQQPQTLTQFFFATIESFRQINLPSEDSDWIWYDSYFEGNVVVTVSKENASWIR